ncbi:hypothetical protein OUZ56_019594 [Daphnia magna]|uniref:CUB domain-containing protein n=1 Tax=Daphnia magna TaxID=35525 RepID=A0ABQ9ZC28_9CRUS|nr:hypothetical protein OUZ56_019594 [Daphnia magna]
MFNKYFSLFGLFLVPCFWQTVQTCDENSNDSQEDLADDSVMTEARRFPFNPWLPYYYYMPMPVEYPTAMSTRTFPAFVPFTSCTTPNREMGICAESGACIRGGGRASGTCDLGRVCCVNVVSNTCDDEDRNVVTLDNTYWLSPTTGLSSTTSSCGLTVKLDAKLPEQGKAVCQVRLNFVLFTIAQPNSESVCNTDTFDVAGASNKIPTICGDNEGQHMYLNVPSSATSPTDLQLSFNFGTNSNSIRAWNILISMIPCDSANLAPLDCLQYFTARTGSVRSFNWRDVGGTRTRQLANQDYSICFKTMPGFTKTLCLTPCTVTSNQLPFSISVASTLAVLGVQIIPAVPRPGQSQLVPLNCNNDFLVIPGGFNSGKPPSVDGMAYDRYCGERLNALPGNGASTTICTTATPFRLLFRTNGDETTTSPTPDSPTNGNRGFCLTFRNQ